MSLLVEEKIYLVCYSPEPEIIIEKVTLSRLKFRVIMITACACLTLFSVYFLQDHSLQKQQHHFMYSTVEKFNNSKISNSCCENKYECWMQCLGKEIAYTKLNSLVIPGTHNSGVYPAVFNDRISNSRSLRDIIRDRMRKQIEMLLRWRIIGWGTFIDLVRRWAICQELSVSEQLTAGVRYLDFRICENHAGRLFLCHMVYGADFLDVLDEVRDFLDTHTKEIVIIDIHTVASGKSTKIANSLFRKFESLLIFDKLNEVVSTLWMKNKRVVVIYDFDERFWPLSAIVRPWPRCHPGLLGAMAMISFNEERITRNSYPKKLRVHDLECSPAPLDILKGHFLPSVYPSSLRENTKTFTYPSLKFSMDWRWSKFPKGSFNIIMVDFIQKGVIDWAIKQNRNNRRTSKA